MVAELPPEVAHEVARRIRLVVLDVDGVMTDGGIYLGATASGEGVELKRFNVQDGLGIRLLQADGITVAIVTARESGAVAARAAELGIAECHQNRGVPKREVVQAMLDRLGIAWEETAFLGDDLPDYPVLRRVGLAAAVGNAVREVRAAVQWQGVRPGGDGAVREFVEALLRGRGSWSHVVNEYLKGLEPREAA
jgi:3-deoxy-D-manno-octulosonate 8-phosphate phosphatase (KDO 8-P phosphatase)